MGGRARTKGLHQGDDNQASQEESDSRLVQKQAGCVRCTATWTKSGPILQAEGVEAATIRWKYGKDRLANAGHGLAADAEPWRAAAPTE